MLKLDLDRVVDPLTLSTREPAPPMPQGTLEAEAVPPAQRPAPLPLVRILMPIVMVAAMAGMIAVMFLGQRAASPMMLMLPLMMGASMLIMFAPPESTQDADEMRRTYLRHLGTLTEKAQKNAQAQRAHLKHRHPDPGDLCHLLETRRLWERGPQDPDAMEARIALGSAELVTPVLVPEPGATEDLDPVCAVSVRRAVRALSTVLDVPIVVNLAAFPYLGVAGTRASSMVRALVAQLVVLHGPETVGISLIGYPDEPDEQWEWLKWLPHTQNPEQARYHLALALVNEVPDTHEYHVIIDVGAQPGTDLFERTEAEGLALEVTEEGNLQVTTTTSGVEHLGRADTLSLDEVRFLARSLTAYRRPHTASTHREGDLLGLLEISDIEQLSPEALWPGHKGSSRLKVPFGITPSGEPVYLDMKESAQGGAGPHGLCVGATGSGKSELLKTLVTALVATHSPDELNLVLVDFKGGATFLGCESLPHTSAVITNLEEEAVLVSRMYEAISGELQRRQEVLRAAGNFANVTDYTGAREGGRDDLDPLPALVIIVDEFSELLSAHPDFADLFVAVGRLGRSLHVHLLLASQRLEEGKLRGLDSHLSYRLGLRTFSAGESRQVLGVPDAHRLPSTPGAGYIRTDAEELTRFSAAYVSGPVQRLVSTGASAGSARVEYFTGWEQYRIPIAEVEMDENTTLFASIVELARTAAKDRGMQAHQVWLPPLPARIGLAKVVDSPGFLQVNVGMIDRPYQQTQAPLKLDLSVAGGHVAICGGPQSGKTMALRTITAALAATHDTTQLRFYAIDLASTDGLGRDLLLLPHVAGVAHRGEPEKVRRIVEEVLGFVDKPEPRHTIVLIDGWHAVGSSEADFADLQEPLTRLAVDGPSARVHVVVSTPRWTVLRSAVRDVIAHRLELKLPDSLDSLINRAEQEKVPGAPGRGLSGEGEQILLAFTAGEDLAHIAAKSQAAGYQRVPSLRTLPERVLLAELEEAEGIALGVGGRELSTIAWDPTEQQHLVCVGSSGSGKSTALATIMAGIGRLGREAARIVLIDHRRAHLGQVPEYMLAAYGGQANASAEALRAAEHTLRERLPGLDISAEDLRRRSWWQGPEIYLVIDDADLVPEASLQGIIELLPHAKDIGLHVVYARSSGGISRALFSGVLAAVKNHQPAVVLLDADKDDGPIFGVKTTRQPAGRATWATRGKAQGLIQIAQTGEKL